MIMRKKIAMASIEPELLARGCHRTDAQTSCVYNWHELGLLEPILLLFIRKPRRLGFFLPENQLYHLYGDGAMVLQGPRLRGDAGTCLLSLQTPGFTEIPANQQLTVSKVPLTGAAQ